MKPSRNLWPYGILAAFLLFGTGLAINVTIAVKHPESLVSENYYEHELKYQDQIDSAARAKTAGAGISFDASAHQVVITLPPAQKTQNVSGTVELYRVDSPELDRNLVFQPQANGTQTLDLTQFASGPWLLKVAWQSGGQGYYLEQRLVIPAS